MDIYSDPNLPSRCENESGCLRKRPYRMPYRMELDSNKAQLMHASLDLRLEPLLTDMRIYAGHAKEATWELISQCGNLIMYLCRIGCAGTVAPPRDRCRWRP